VGALGAKEGFYRGRIAEAIVAAAGCFDGVLAASDLEVITALTRPLPLFIYIF
jgi:gamma-glutamyltranspeptidase